MDSLPLSTLYPKITTHIPEIVKTLQCHKRDTGPDEDVNLDPIPITGTIKLHGTHADVLIAPFPSSIITFQSRNNVSISHTADNYGFAATMTSKRDTLLGLRDRYIARWKTLNPYTELNVSIPVTIAGEWIGPGIQKGVAIANLSRRFVIISAKINGSWVNDIAYADIEAPDDDIYNISRGGFYHSTLHPSSPQTTITELEELAEKVASQCPFAASFGITGPGEGLVWKLDPYISDSSLWFKTKGGKFKPTFVPPPKELPASMEEKRKAAVAVSQAWCTQQRLEQGLNYLSEKGIPRGMMGIGEFLKWVQLDILGEEKGYIVAHRVDEGMLRQAIIGIAKPWFLASIAGGTRLD
jgi:hypothetical protein